MVIYTKGVRFECKHCMIAGIANVAPDFRIKITNDTKKYFIVCPNCQTMIEVSASDIPDYIRNFIFSSHEGFGYHD